MISMFLVWLIGITLSILLFRRIKGDEEVKGFLLALVFTILLVGTPMGLSFWGASAVVMETHTVQDRLDVVAIKDNTLVEGRLYGGIFIISGYIKESPAYFFYRRVGEGYTQDSMKAKGVTIFEDTPIGVGYIIKTDIWKEVSPDWKKAHLHWLLFDTRIRKETTYEVHIPKGSIIKEFVLDAS